MPAVLTRNTARTIQLRAATANDENRSIEAIVSTENVVAVLDTEDYTVIDEVLLASGADLPPHGQAVMLSQHIRNLDSVLGSARNLRREGTEIRATLFFADDPESLRVWRKVRDGHVTDPSVGYLVEEAVEIRPGQSEIVRGKTYVAKQRKLRIVTHWPLKEVSMAAIGADPGAKTRADYLPLENQNMRVNLTSEPRDKLRDAMMPVLARAGHSMRFADLGKASLRFLGLEVPDGDSFVVRAMTADKTIGDLIDHVFGAAVVGGSESYPDTTRSWTREMSARNFIQSELFVLATGGRLGKIGRGGTAEETGAQLAGTTYRLARYGAVLTIDETEMVDGQDIGAHLLLANQLGAEAARVRPDLVYSLILANAAMAYDNVDLFHADHGNLTATAMATGLAEAMAGIGNQVMNDEDDRPIHLNNSPAVLAVPPDLAHSARSTVRDITLNDGQDIRVLSESRLSATGVVDPDGDDTQTGSATNFLVATRAAALPSIVVLGLEGSLEPKTRRFDLDQGQWGLGYDVKVDIAAVAIDHRGVYWSSGTG